MFPLIVEEAMIFGPTQITFSSGHPPSDFRLRKRCERSEFTLAMMGRRVPCVIFCEYSIVDVPRKRGSLRWWNHHCAMRMRPYFATPPDHDTCMFAIFFVSFVSRYVCVKVQT